MRPPPRSTLFPYTTLFRSLDRESVDPASVLETSLASLQTLLEERDLQVELDVDRAHGPAWLDPGRFQQIDRKSTRLNSSHGYISYAVFCLKNKTSREHF